MPQILESLRKFWLDMLQGLHERFEKGEISEKEFTNLADNILDEILKIDEQLNNE
jgi:hypothetical protein